MGLTVGALMRRAAVHYADETAVISGDRSLSFRDAWARAIRLANGLLAAGLQPGDRVAVLEDNSLEAQDFFAGTAIANLVRVPLYARDGRPFQLHKLSHTQCKALVVDSKYASFVPGLVDELPDLKFVFVRDASYENWLSCQSDADPNIGGSENDPHVIRHTGGTTGKAKGVAYSHRKWIASGRDWTYRFPPICVGDRCLHVSPISHGSGYLYLPMWLQGAANVLTSSGEPVATLRLMEEKRVSYMFAVPTLVSALTAQLEATPRGLFLKALLVAGAPISERTALRAREVFGPVLYQMYGQTESQPITFMSPEEWFGSKAGSNPLRSAGRPLPFAGLEIRDEEGRELPAGSEGEIVVSSEGQMDGYWGAPELSEKRLKGGWVLTGDIGSIDENGFLYILDRKDDVIISGGFNIWPAELENAISAHPEVIEVVVFGIPHEKWGETPMAVCVVADPQKVSAEEIVRLCENEVGSHKKPGVVHFQTENLPKSAVGKVQRKLIRSGFGIEEGDRVQGA
jgi:acyl-CoA synthetase (AMP-forming)/AMP-acid ligase II